MAAHTLEGIGVFQVREEFADEGENHADFDFIEASTAAPLPRQTRHLSG
jgi:hypothetical protein